MANIVNNYCSTIVTIASDVIKNYERNLDIIKESEEELNDLYHEAELSAPKDMYKGYLIYKSIREVRIRRRTAKDENQILQEMYDYFKSPAGQAVKSKVQSIQSKVQSIQSSAAKLREVQERRTYTPRQRSDLTCTDQTSTAHKPFEAMLKEFNDTKVSIKNGKLRK